MKEGVVNCVLRSVLSLTSRIRGDDFSWPQCELSVKSTFVDILILSVTVSRLTLNNLQ